MENKMCSEIENFYKSFIDDEKYKVIKRKTIGNIGGIKNTYFFNSNVGYVEVSCESKARDSPMAFIDILFHNSNGNSVVSEHIIFSNPKMVLDKNGVAEVESIISSSQYRFPVPVPIFKLDYSKIKIDFLD